jgi:hypothetical protein
VGAEPSIYLLALRWPADTAPCLLISCKAGSNLQMMFTLQPASLAATVHAFIYAHFLYGISLSALFVCVVTKYNRSGGD